MAAANDINGIGDGAKENKKAAPYKMRITDINTQLANIGNKNSGIREQQGYFLRAHNRLLKHHGIDENRKGWIQEKDQPLESGCYIFQAYKIKQAAEVITKNAKGNYTYPL